MLDTALRHIVNRKYTTAREIGELVGVSTSTVYRWMNGESQPDFESIRLLVRHLGHPRAQEAILSVFASGTLWHFIHGEIDLDANGDGNIDVDDALDASCNAVRSVAESLQHIRNLCRNTSVSADDRLRLVELLDQAVRQCTLAQRVVVNLSDADRKKRLRIAR